MNWEAIGAIAELFGAVAVFASLVYLSIQVRHSAGVSKASAFQAIFDGVAAHNNHMFGPENVDLVIRSLRGYPRVPVEDRMRFDNLMTNLLNYFEASVLAADAEALGEETMENWAWWFEAKIFAYPGAVNWWARAQAVYPDNIRSWIDRRIASADQNSDYWGLFESAKEASEEPPEAP